MRVVAVAAAAAATDRKAVLKDSRDEKRAFNRSTQESLRSKEKKLSFARAHIATPAKLPNLLVTDIALPNLKLCTLFRSEDGSGAWVVSPPKSHYSAWIPSHSCAFAK